MVCFLIDSVCLAVYGNRTGFYQDCGGFKSIRGKLPQLENGERLSLAPLHVQINVRKEGQDDYQFC
jgi:hypothetical protein